MTDFAFAEGDLVRIDKKVPGIVQSINMTRGETTLWTDFGTRTVLSSRLGPSKAGDSVQRVPKEAKPPARKRGQR